MIEQAGIVKITELKIEIKNFRFNIDGLAEPISAYDEIIDWAITRLESERIPIVDSGVLEKGAQAE